MKRSGAIEIQSESTSVSGLNCLVRSDKSPDPCQDARNLCVLDRELGFMEFCRMGTSIVLESPLPRQTVRLTHCQLAMVNTRVGHCRGAACATARR